VLESDKRSPEEGYRVRSVAGLEMAARVAGVGVAGRRLPRSAEVGRDMQINARRRRLPNGAARRLSPVHPSMEAAFGPQHAEIVFEGVESPCYPYSQLSADGVVAILTHRPN